MATINIVKQARELLEMTPAEFGKHLDITRQTVWRYESGDPIPRIVELAVMQLLSDHQLSHAIKREKS